MDNIKDIFQKRAPQKKPPAYQWQDLALKIIEELAIPDFKKSSIFKICRDNSQAKIMQALTDTRELCKTGQKWQYFLKVITNKKPYAGNIKAPQ